MRSGIYDLFQRRIREYLRGFIAAEDVAVGDMSGMSYTQAEIRFDGDKPE